MARIIDNDQEKALENFLEQFGKWDLQDDLGPKLSCAEVNALDEMLRQFGEETENLMESHADADDAGDAHYRRGA